MLLKSALTYIARRSEDTTPPNTSKDKKNRMIDELSASWKVLLPYKPDSKVLALGLDTGQLASLARTWQRVDYDFVNDKDSLATLPERLLRCLTNLSQRGACTDTSYDIIILGNIPAKHYEGINKIYPSILAEGGVMACIGFSGCSLAGLILKKQGRVVEKYGVLPRNKPRIIFPLSDRILRSKGLMFHQPGRWQASLGVLAATLLSNLGFVMHLEKGAVSIIHNGQDKIEYTLKSWLTDRLGLPIRDLVLYCGSDTVQRKITALAVISEGKEVIVKIADTLAGKDAISRETTALKSLVNTDAGDFRFPELVMEDEWSGYLVQVQTNLSKGSSRQTRKLCDLHLGLLAALSKLNRREISFGDTSCYQKIQELSECQESNLPNPLNRIADAIFSPTFQKTRILCHRIHGDFAPWNMNMDNRGLSLWDWEDSLEDGIVYTDIFHFIIRQAILVGPWSGAVRILKTIKNACSRLQKFAALPSDVDYITPFQVWLVLEYMRNPSRNLIEIAEQLEAFNG